MSTLKQVRVAARELDQADDLVDRLQLEKGKLQSELADTNTKLDAAKTDRDDKKAAFKLLVADLA
jgi:chromosome segregation ATPase